MTETRNKQAAEPSTIMAAIEAIDVQIRQGKLGSAEAGIDRGRRAGMVAMLPPGLREQFSEGSCDELG